jgi:5-methylcytosine-specific restriction enzyme A
LATFLFAWNPKLWPWDEADLRKKIQAVHSTGHADDSWSCGNTKVLPVASRFFLIKLGAEPRGIIGSGLTLTPPEPQPHWDEEKAAKGQEALMADVRFDFLSSDPVISWAELRDPPFAKFNWGIRASGVQIPAPVAAAVESLWTARTAVSPSLSPDEIEGLGDYFEGAKKVVTVNAYERDPKARAACIAHHGRRCKVCDTVLADRYGAIASQLVHVHHLIPLSNIGATYKVDPINDLVPVCPNCHAVIHLRRPNALSISDARALLRKARRLK